MRLPLACKHTEWPSGGFPPLWTERLLFLWNQCRVWPIYTPQFPALKRIKIMQPFKLYKKSLQIAACVSFHHCFSPDDISALAVWLWGRFIILGWLFIYFWPGFQLAAGLFVALCPDRGVYYWVGEFNEVGYLSKSFPYLYFEWKHIFPLNFLVSVFFSKALMHFGSGLMRWQGCVKCLHIRTKPVAFNVRAKKDTTYCIMCIILFQFVFEGFHWAQICST